MAEIPTPHGARTPGTRLRPRPEARVARKTPLFDLRTEAEALMAEQPWKAHGHNAKTLVQRIDSSVVLIAMRKHAHLHQPERAASVTILAESGRLRVHLPNEVAILSSGMVLAIAPGIAFELEATEQSILLLTYAEERRKEALRRARAPD